MADRPKMTHRQRNTQRAIRLGFGAVLAVVMTITAVSLDRCLPTPAPTDDMARYDGKTFTVKRAVDGDTLILDVPDAGSAETRVRLWGVDTPETVRENHPVEHFGPEASKQTKTWTEGRTVRLELVPTRTRGDYGRLLAYVYLPDGSMLNPQLVEQGYAYASPGGGRFDHPRKKQFLKLQRQAMREGRGLWAEVQQKDLPKYYRYGRYRLELPQRDGS
ncbi:MAG: thermonuclease family protein [Phycisphaerae bacterium]